MLGCGTEHTSDRLKDNGDCASSFLLGTVKQFRSELEADFYAVSLSFSAPVGQ